ncbi:MAG: hypothetical protein V4494_02615 [Chlamydiota bacterium]
MSIKLNLKSPLSVYLQEGDEQNAQLLIDSLEKEYNFDINELWQMKVFKGVEFTDGEFLALNTDVQRLVYRTANNLSNVGVIERINSLVDFNFPCPVEEPSFISLYMNISEISQRTFNLLVSLRRQEKFLLNTEMQQLKSANNWIEKNNFTRILGREYLSRLIAEFSVKHIRVPDKKVVVNSEKENISFSVRRYEDFFSLQSSDISIYAEEIPAVRRCFTQEELIELVFIINKSNFTDLWINNFILSDKYVYIIDTEFKSFSGVIEWGKMHRLFDCIASQDKKWFTELIKNTHKTYMNNHDDNIDLDPPDYPFATRYIKNLKTRALKGENCEYMQEELVKNKQIVKQVKLVGSNKGRVVSFSVQKICS